MESNILLEIPRLHTALAEWAACMIFVLILKNRFQGKKLIAFSVIGLVIQGAFQIFAETLPLELWVPAMLFAVGFMFIFIYKSCIISARDAFYCCIRAFVLAEFAASLEWQIFCFMNLNKESNLFYFGQIGIMLVVYSIIFFAAYRLEHKSFNEEQILNVRFRELFSAAIIGVATFTMSNLSFIYTNTPFSARFDNEIFLVRTVISFGGLAVLYAHHILVSELRNKHELNAIKNVLQRQYDQYELSKENNELLNIKYHDMKHQINVIRTEKDSEKREGYLSDLEKHLKIYESNNKTGNKVLDMILMNKSMICANKDIEFTCVINGALLNFMDAMDICTIFGNALDNAIECESKIEDKKKRMIHTAVFSKANLLMIKFENYFDSELKDLVAGIPETTKPDHNYHGYGLKSIRYSVKKYRGSVTINKNNDWFELKILIPLKNDSIQ